MPDFLGKEGIRMGLQEMTRYGLTSTATTKIAELIVTALREETPVEEIKQEIRRVRQALHQNPFDFSLPETKLQDVLT